MNRFRIAILLVVALLTVPTFAQTAISKVERGSRTAKAGFRNEDEIAAKFRDWRADAEAKSWLTALSYSLGEITDVSASKPHGEKADVVVLVTTAKGTFDHGVSIKLVSGSTGFNQIDKRWLRQYAAKWKMPAEVVKALRLFTGEDPPNKPSRDPRRMYIDEFDAETQKRIADFFSANREMIVSDLLEGDGEDRADFLMVAMKGTTSPRWKMVRIAEAIRFFGQGPVEITRSGNLKIGRVSMQRKGGDGGRETAKMLQFKINPALLFELK